MLRLNISNCRGFAACLDIHICHRIFRFSCRLRSGLAVCAALRQAVAAKDRPVKAEPSLVAVAELLWNSVTVF
jgi:hypothetical protein